MPKQSPFINDVLHIYGDSLMVYCSRKNYRIDRHRRNECFKEIYAILDKYELVKDKENAKIK